MIKSYAIRFSVLKFIKFTRVSGTVTFGVDRIHAFDKRAFVHNDGARAKARRVDVYV